ncbi:MAG TPA: DUF3011 domain-containing protein [Rhodanobacteraceae bacterium]|jgi:hypothetical protein|nr:DUF3011 domain-containing protein [Rhodanobacteraceae bacterium]
MRNVSIVFATFALVFSAAAIAQVTYSNRPPPPPPQNPPPYPPGQQGVYPGYPGYPGNPNGTVSCGSPQYRLARCPTPNFWRGARIVRQTSKSSCVQGRSWGFDRGGIWVDNGCGGIFAPGNYQGDYAGGWQPPPGWDRDFAVSCGSPQYRYYFCQVDVGSRGRVVMQRQMSDTRCIEGQNWGWNRAGIWVDKGCGAQFLVTRRW